jgi:hypothetical protein
LKIYEHPLNCDVTIIEIEKSDEREAFLNDIITGFDEFGSTYPSASYDNNDGKKVIYFDGRQRKIFGMDDVDVLCALTVGLAKLDSTDIDGTDTATKCLSLAEAAGNQQLIETLMSQPPEYFSSFQTEQRR